MATNLCRAGLHQIIVRRDAVETRIDARISQTALGAGVLHLDAWPNRKSPKPAALFVGAYSMSAPTVRGCHVGSRCCECKPLRTLGCSDPRRAPGSRAGALNVTRDVMEGGSLVLYPGKSVTCDGGFALVIYIKTILWNNTSRTDAVRFASQEILKPPGGQHA